MSLPQGKLESLQLELLNWQKKRRVTKKELQQIIGKLNWAAKVVRAVRPFMRRLINLLPTVVQSHHHIRLSAAAKKDIAWLLSFSMQFNGVAFWLSANPLPDHAMASDATSYAAAAVHSGDYYYSDFRADSPELIPQPIHVKEIYAVLLAFRRWKFQWNNKKIHVYTDNTIAQSAINKGMCKCEKSMPFIREIYMLMATHNIYVVAKRVDTKSNAIADALSRMSDYPFMLKASKLLQEWDIQY